MMPILFPGVDGHGINPNKGKGVFERMDFFDIMIIIDFMGFLAVLLFIWIYITSALYPTSNIKTLLRLDSLETK